MSIYLLHVIVELQT